MKAILMALAVTAMAYTSAEAQSKRYKIVEKEVCKTSPDMKTETCQKTVYHYDDGVYIGKEPTTITARNYIENTDVEAQVCEKSPKSNIIVCQSAKSTEAPTYYKVCRDDGGYSMYCTPYIPTNSTWPYSKL